MAIPLFYPFGEPVLKTELACRCCNPQQYGLMMSKNIIPQKPGYNNVKATMLGRRQPKNSTVFYPD
jgi:hypothetical protein